MQVQTKLSTNSHLRYGYLFSAKNGFKSIKIHYVSEFIDTIKVSVCNGKLNFESDNIYVNEQGSITKKSELPFTHNAFKQYQHLYKTIRTLKLLLDRKYSLSGGYEILEFTIKIVFYLVMKDSPVKTVIDYNNDYRKVHLEIFNQLKKEAYL